MLLFDDELAKNNPKETYIQSLKKEIADYDKRSRQIRQTDVCDSDDVLYTTDPNNDDKLAYVTASYFVKEDKSFTKTYQMYVLRKDKNKNWKILTYYQIDKNPNEDATE